MAASQSTHFDIDPSILDRNISRKWVYCLAVGGVCGGWGGGGGCVCVFDIVYQIVQIWDTENVLF